MYTKILIRYGELTLKGENKKDFIKTLKDNLLLYIKKDELKVEFDRAFATYSNQNLESLKFIFGISSYSPAIEVETDLEIIKQELVKFAKTKSFNSFAIASRRHDKKFDLTSNELNKVLGEQILKNFKNKSVNLTSPDIKFYIEVRDARTFIFSDYIQGLGGMPVNTAGKVLHLISGGIDSPVAANLLQKRGLKVYFINFITPPQTDKKTVEKVDQIIENLTHYQGNSLLFQINYSKVMNYLSLVSNQKYKITLMRRSFYRIAQNIAKKYEIKALSNGENLAQVASQTLESIHTISQVVDLPIFRPLLTYDKLEIIEKAKAINTFNISLIKACETCELFAPKSPVTRPNIEEALRLEKELDKLSELEDEAINLVEIKKFSLKND
ncbi:thiamine biosynthesis protein ThiI [Metamycoplasma subdolum]|uniref:Probable tRNA sulfurtransferase n=1 Tax=Metamycoplasma subdolum TaxID=92407 RepID=A0A3L9ZXF2_9BACT|nr:tRNA uracil 4-sulfurtransferase ThiI [Metamycoplasma subdolum]RMA77561.1 thiamine biosynthesis protein ThiI [Metamycoplasma subdolum]WPB50355.1 tRNA uracil 4-sulfurtransferase ThiI [Metamycoplasma subdolum]